MILCILVLNLYLAAPEGLPFLYGPFCLVHASGMFLFEFIRIWKSFIFTFLGWIDTYEKRRKGVGDGGKIWKNLIPYFHPQFVGPSSWISAVIKEKS